MNVTSMFGRVNQRIIYQAPVDNKMLNTNQPSFMKMNYTNNLRMNPVSDATISSPKIDLVNTDAVKSTNTMTWGKPTWFLLHTLAEKVKEEQFSNVRKELLDIIYAICTNLPCPDCANHARTYLDGINFNVIQTKEDLKMMLFIFHNSLNQRKGYKIFTKDELDTKYTLANTINIIQNFMAFYLVKNSAPKMIANDMFRRRIMTNVQEWFIKNLYQFTP